MQSTSKKTALITGANKGIGFEIARQLGKAGLLGLPRVAQHCSRRSSGSKVETRTWMFTRWSLISIEKKLSLPQHPLSSLKVSDLMCW